MAINMKVILLMEIVLEKTFTWAESKNKYGDFVENKRTGKGISLGLKAKINMKVIL